MILEYKKGLYDWLNLRSTVLNHLKTSKFLVYIDIFAKLRSILVIRHSLAGLESGMIQIKRTRPLKRKQTQKEKRN